MSVPAWLVVAVVTVLAAIAVNQFLNADSIRWFNRLQRPSWLVFENAIPLIWTTVFIGVAWSAVVTWNADPNSPETWVLMGNYLVLELVTLAYTPAMCRCKSLTIGTIIGATGFVLAALLAIAVQPRSNLAAWLFLPYLLWSPIGTYTTWAMIRLNPNER